MLEQRCWNCWTDADTVRSTVTNVVYCLSCGAARPVTGKTAGKERREDRLAGGAGHEEREQDRN